MSFIENLTAQSVNMDPDEFDNYTSGRSVPLESWRSNLLMCDGLQKMSHNLKLLSSLKQQQEQILLGAQKLEAEMNKFQSEMSFEVEALLDRTQYEIKKSKEAVDLDEDIGDLGSDLPAPLLPDSANLAPNLSSPNPKHQIKINQINPNKALENPSLNPTLEDFLSASDSISLLSLDMSLSATPGPSGVPNDLDDSMIYQGFSAQSSKIPSISCDNAVQAGKEAKLSSSSDNLISGEITSTDSSSPIISVPTSPETVGHSTPKKSSSSSEDGEDREPVAAKVLSGLFDTFDNLI